MFGCHAFADLRLEPDGPSTAIELRLGLEVALSDFMHRWLAVSFPGDLLEKRGSGDGGAKAGRELRVTKGVMGVARPPRLPHKTYRPCQAQGGIREPTGRVQGSTGGCGGRSNPPPAWGPPADGVAARLIQCSPQRTAP